MEIEIPLSKLSSVERQVWKNLSDAIETKEDARTSYL